MVCLFDVEYYEKDDGTYPAEEFILSQDMKMQAKLFHLLELLELKGNELREPYSKPPPTVFSKYVRFRETT